MIKRALEAGLIEMAVTNPRDFTKSRHRQVDDTIYGGGAGMLMMCQPLFDACHHVLPEKDQGIGSFSCHRQERPSPRTGPRNCSGTMIIWSSSAATMKAWTTGWKNTWRTNSSPSETTSSPAANWEPWLSATPWPAWCPAFWETQEAQPAIPSMNRSWNTPVHQARRLQRLESAGRTPFRTPCKHCPVEKKRSPPPHHDLPPGPSGRAGAFQRRQEAHGRNQEEKEE